MSLTESKTNTKITLAGSSAHRTILVVEDNHISRDSVVISTGNVVDHELVPGSLVDGVYTQTNLENHSGEVRALAEALWTAEAHTNYEAFLRQS
ncbi:MAG: hypothetical protein K0U41_06955 [Gammaproteobacteria bacterium]|nr:hypothetical protein [Gammaproteobacteria bacterium]